MKSVVIEYQYYKKQGGNKSLCSQELTDIASKRIVVTNHPFEDDGKSIILNHTNQGKDLGGKLIGIDYLLNTNQEFDLLFLLHDKRSPHSPLGNFWFNELTYIFQEPSLSILLKEMNKPEIGVCCSKNYIKSEYVASTKSFQTSNNEILIQLMDAFKVYPPKPYSFVAGTMFCCKWNPLKEFFSKFDAMEIRSSLEKGNVQDIGMGTYTHSWERILPWILTSQGFSIKGL
ncbi:hypothetical protein [Rufibacter roseolus]|uniref:hypothetical protein n=1 Tax=Rufibacter roseolus TaxID=2817375 RepID=UPI001B31424A|nr:hypothetical protein [Rufibacter roseolus]